MYETAVFFFFFFWWVGTAIKLVFPRLTEFLKEWKFGGDVHFSFLENFLLICSVNLQEKKCNRWHFSFLKVHNLFIYFCILFYFILLFLWSILREWGSVAHVTEKKAALYYCWYKLGTPSTVKCNVCGNRP